MNPRTLVPMAVMAVALVSVPAHAQAPLTYDFKVPFDFIANGRAFKAGDYMLVPNADNNEVFLESKRPNRPSVVLPVRTRLDEAASLDKPEVVFERYEGKLVVAELEVPGMDGYAFVALDRLPTR